ncbi:hypothetical protein BN938_0827 [Mucinivorans hirudinis]|uniref:Adhesin domain-containing protein n=1 Tax=Mucinivorans hirudinis TaxID=1433126 RepID=A0A060RAX9_9BACT|nr:hypothetical protein BN938_0827 [Mucinivorans hirudinis]
MKTKILFLLIFALAIGTSTAAYRYEKSRTENYSYNVRSGSALSFDARYSNLIFTTTESDKVTIAMEIKTQSNNEQQATELLRLPVTNFSNVTGAFQMTADIDSEITKRYRNISYTINYFISIPRKYALRVDVKYGDAKIDRVEDNALFNVKYGNITVRESVNAASKFDIKYGNIAIAGDIRAASEFNIGYGNLSFSAATGKEKHKIYIKYGNVKGMNNSGKIYIESAYCDIKFGEVESLSGTSKYDNYTVGAVGSIDFESANYCNFKIERLSEKLNLDSFKYSNLKIGGVSPNFRSITIPAAGYSNIKIAIPSGSFKADLRTKYAKAQVYDTKSEGSLVTTVGGNPRATIEIFNSYGDIIITK